MDQPKALLGRSACVRLGLIECTCGVGHINSDNGAIFQDEFKLPFEGLGRMHLEVDIELQTNKCFPFSINTPHSVPYPLPSRVKLELMDMVTKGVILEIENPTEWVAPTMK